MNNFNKLSDWEIVPSENVIEVLVKVLFLEGRNKDKKCLEFLQKKLFDLITLNSNVNLSLAEKIKNLYYNFKCKEKVNNYLRQIKSYKLDSLAAIAGLSYIKLNELNIKGIRQLIDFLISYKFFAYLFNKIDFFWEKNSEYLKEKLLGLNDTSILPFCEQIEQFTSKEEIINFCKEEIKKTKKEIKENNKVLLEDFSKRSQNNNPNNNKTKKEIKEEKNNTTDIFYNTPENTKNTIIIDFKEVYKKIFDSLKDTKDYKSFKKKYDNIGDYSDFTHFILFEFIKFLSFKWKELHLKNSSVIGSFLNYLEGTQLKENILTIRYKDEELFVKLFTKSYNQFEKIVKDTHSF